MSKGTFSNAQKRLIIAFAIILTVLLVLYAIILAIPYFEQENATETSEIIADFDFYPVDYSEDIFLDEEYMSKISSGLMTYNDRVMTVTVDPDSAIEHGDGVKLLVDMVYSVVNGNVSEYNSYFSDKYYERNERKQNFTMQKIYNCQLTYFSQESKTEDGVSFIECTYKLKYNIYKNNGSFRKDIGEDSRVQYITVSDRTGKLLIDSVATAIYK